MAMERVIGVDFGTSTSVIRIKRYENGKPVGEMLDTKEVIFAGNGMVPTLVSRKNGDASVCYYGYEAKQKKTNYSNYHSFKMDLESDDPEKRILARGLTADFYGYLAKQYKSQSEGGHFGSSDDRERTIVSYPVKWSEETKEFVLETAKKAGFPNVTGMDEAQAAIQAVIVMNAEYLREKGLLQRETAANILLIDMGAGTTDLVLARHIPGDAPKTEVLNTWPKGGSIQFGGREVDSLLRNYFQQLLRDEDAKKVEKIFRRVGVDKFKSWKESTVSPALLKEDSVSDFSALDDMLEDEEIGLEYCLDRACFENCLADYLKQLPELINGCLENAGMGGGEIDLVIVTGGHSQWYFVNEMLMGKMPQFGNLDMSRIRENPARIIPISRPQETVALGLAYSGIHLELSTQEPVPEPAPEPTPEPAPEPHYGDFSMRIDPDQVFETGQGIVISGVIEEGQVKTGDRVYICGIANGRPLSDVVKQIIRGDTYVQAAQKGDEVGLLLPFLKKDEVTGGTHLSGKPEGKRFDPIPNPSPEPRPAAPLGASTYRIPEGKSIEGAVVAVKAVLAPRKLEIQDYMVDGCYIVQARKKTNGFGKITGGDKAVEVRFIPVGDDCVSVKIGGGKWLDKAGGMILSSLAVGPLVPAGLIVYGANAIDQAIMIDNVTRAVKKYFSS